MAVLKYYDGDSWEPVVSALQGPTGATGVTGPTGSTASNKVVQVVNATYSTEVGTNSSTYTDTVLTATITPTSASNKILVLVTHGGVAKFTNNTWGEFKLMRASTDLAVFEAQAGRNDTTTTNVVGGLAFNYLDSPATTSATAYKTRVRAPQNTGTVYVQLNNSHSSITLIEVTP
jgi:hypothetical protein